MLREKCSGRSLVCVWGESTSRWHYASTHRVGPCASADHQGATLPLPCWKATDVDEVVAKIEEIKPDW